MPVAGNYKKIYIRAPNWVGDVVAATAIFREVAHTYPAAEIVIGIRPHLKPILRAGPWYSRLIDAEENHGVASIFHAAQELKKEQFDLALILPNSFRSAAAAFLARIPQRVGYSVQARGFLLTHRLTPSRTRFHAIHVPMVYYYLNLVGLAGVILNSIRPELYYEEEEGRAADQFLLRAGLDPKERFALVSPGASFGSSKLWNPESFAKVVDGLYERFGLRSVVHCGPGEEEICKLIEAKAKHKPIRTYDAKRDLHTLKPIVDRAALLVTTDSGPRHYGVAFNKPIVCLMGPTHPNCTQANMEKTEVLRVEVECGPCHLKVCPLDHRCMTQITPEMVLEAVHKLA